MNARIPQTAASGLDSLDRQILNRLQDGLPLEPRPFLTVAREIGCSEQELIERLQRLLGGGIATRFGPFLDAEAMGGAFCLCAIAVPEGRLNEVAATVNGFAEVAHNYQREHRLDMWFVLATETPAEIETVAIAIETATGLEVLQFPKLEEYFIGFKVAA